MSYNTQAEPTAAYSFDLTTNGNATTIHYKRAKYGIGLLMTMLFVAAIAASILGMLLRFNAVMWVMTWLSLSVGLYYYFNASRKDGTFTITPDKVLVDGKPYDRLHINKIMLDGKMMAEDRYVISNPRATTLINGAVRASYRRHYEKNNHFIAFRYGEQMITLAGGLRENTADVLYQKVLALMDFESY